ncbi:hypothetical protein HYV50_05785 [Candidatus Pacearchaeota archaeon]|nr:hypothetical protein [Candidatus Pacearchaeota archaeon]
MEEKEKKVRKITHLYYSNPKVRESMIKFGKHREVVPRYFENFGKRPDMIQYSSDIIGLVKKGATSFHASEELWNEPLNLNSELSQEETNKLRKGWDLLIDIDSKYLDISKILTILVLEALEEHGVKNYGVKFSGKKGMHVIVSSKAFPEEFNGVKTKDMFPEWPRAICEYLMQQVRRDFNKRVSEIFGNFGMEKFEIKKEIREALCPNCNRPAKKGILTTLRCPLCKASIQRKDIKATKKRLRCTQENCAGILEIENEGEYFECKECGISNINKQEVSGRYAATFTNFAREERYSSELKEEYSGASFGSSDFVLVAPRHLFRMPYSLHEGTGLASVVLTKEEIESFEPKHADPLKIKIREFMPNNFEGEARRLLSSALEWKKSRDEIEKKTGEKKYKDYEKTEINSDDIKEEMFPAPIKKLLNGLEDGRKRGLFILITFLRALNFSGEYVNKRAREWNEKNKPPLKEGYVKSQIEWHLKQRKKILPPNYSNDGFYRDLGLIEKKPDTKNPIVEVLRKVRKFNYRRF